ncbi:hypothetical protein HIM_04474 [Hirsutella minnesotensis 3608]|uniref:Uncharacterized protein n=1 Tax=Hirsutella minnesotensis 3608 TaxID=1043627 RepID=A0A0F7ZV54_9HYPO|nr:hypothetical protein HIM_04474 [Hirsutella minnesotensis 3608]
MLSAKEHVQYWAVSAAAAAFYQALVHGLGLDSQVMEFWLYASAFEAIFLMRHSPRLRALPTARFIYSSPLLVPLGAATRLFRVPNMDVERFQWVIHVLLAFTALGVVEPPQQNRRELQPWFLGMTPRLRHKPYKFDHQWRLFYMSAFTRVFLLALTALVERSDRNGLVCLGLGLV